jgi:hypothetical protein
MVAALYTDFGQFPAARRNYLRLLFTDPVVRGIHPETCNSPGVGDLTPDCDTWDSPDGSGQRLMVLAAEPGTPSTTPALPRLLDGRGDRGRLPSTQQH